MFISYLRVELADCSLDFFDLVVFDLDFSIVTLEQDEVVYARHLLDVSGFPNLERRRRRQTQLFAER